MKRSQIKSRPKGTSAWQRKVREQVKLRAGGACEVRAVAGCHGRGYQLHHRMLRSQGGQDTLPGLLSVCLPCHEFIHRNPDISFSMGWLVRSHDDPALVPVKALSGQERP